MQEESEHKQETEKEEQQNRKRQKTEDRWWSDCRLEGWKRTVLSDDVKDGDVLKLYDVPKPVFLSLVYELLNTQKKRVVRRTVHAVRNTTDKLVVNMSNRTIVNGKMDITKDLTTFLSRLSQRVLIQDVNEQNHAGQNKLQQEIETMEKSFKEELEKRRTVTLNPGETIELHLFEETVMGLIKTFGNHGLSSEDLDAGISRTDLESLVKARGIGVESLDKVIDSLQTEGYIYSTIDEDHFKSTR